MSGPARAEAVAALANMTISALGGTGERRAQDHEQSPGQGGADLPAAILDGPGPRAHRVDQEPVRPGGDGGRAGLGAHLDRGDRHRPGDLRKVGGGPGGVHRAGDQDVPGRCRGDLRDRDHPAGPVQCRRGAAGGVRPDHRHPADRRRRRLRPRRRERPRAAGVQGDNGGNGAARDGAAAAGQQAGRGRARRAADPAARRAGPRRRRRYRDRPRCRGPGRHPGRVRRVRRLRVGLRGGRRILRPPVPAARLRRRVGRAAALGQAHPRPGPGDLEEPGLRRSVRVRPLHLPPHRRPVRHGAYRDHRTAPRRMAGADQRPPRGLHHLGGLPGERSQAGGQPHRCRGPAAAGGHRAVPGNHRLRQLRQADDDQLPHRSAARL